MTMPKVLIQIPFVRFRQIVFSFVSRLCCEDCCTAVQVQRDVAFEPNGKAQIRSCRKAHRAASGSSSNFNRFIDGSSVNRYAIAFRAERFDIVDASGLGKLAQRKYQERK